MPCFLLNSKDDAFVIFRDAALNNMTEAGHVWIVTEQALNANNTPDGVLGLQLNYANSEKEHIRVSDSTNGQNIICLYINEILFYRCRIVFMF